MASSVIYYSTDARKNEIYLLNKITLGKKITLSAIPTNIEIICQTLAYVMKEK